MAYQKQYTPPGNTDAPVEWIITNGSSESAGITITNDVTGQAFAWANTLAAGALLKLDGADTLNCYVSTDGGSNYTRVNTNRSGTIPWLRGGVQNTITFDGLTAGFSIDVNFYARLL